MLVAAVCGAYVTGAALGWGSSAPALLGGEFGLSAAALVAALYCFRFARAQPRGRTRSAWVLFGLSSVMSGVAHALCGGYEGALGRAVPATAAADCFYLLFVPFALLGLLMLAKRPISRAGWICLSLDTWLIAGSLLTLSWSVDLLPRPVWQWETVAQSALEMAYPLLGVVLMSLILALHFRGATVGRPAFNTLVGAFGVTVLCDMLAAVPALRDDAQADVPLDVGWFVGPTLLAYAAWAGLRGRTNPSPSDTPGTPKAGWSGASFGARPMSGSLAALTPYLAAAVCTLGVVYGSLDGRIDRLVLFTGCTVVLALAVRQGIMLLENIALTQELADKENHFRSLVQGSSDVIMIAAPDGVLRYVSPAAAGVYGRVGDELVGSELAALIHPEDLARVLHEIRRFLAAAPSTEPSTRIECRFQHGAGHWLSIESTVNRYQGGLIFNSRDVTERVRLQAKLQHSASHDPMTDLPNRALFLERVRQALAGRRGGDSEAAVLYIDLDGFKAVNDTVGHQAGDELLIHAAHRLRESVRAGDTAARLGGDEFAALILGDGDAQHRPPAARAERIREIADRLRVTLSAPYHVEGCEVRVAASIGIAFAEPGSDPTDLMRKADLAMYRAKQTGKDRVELYSSAAAPESRATEWCPPRAPRATERAGGSDSAPPHARRVTSCHRQFVVRHQPIVALSGGTVEAVAAQPRLRSAHGVPGERLGADSGPPVTAHGRAGPTAHGDPTRSMSRWLLEEAVAQAAARYRAGFEAPVVVRLATEWFTDEEPVHGSVETLLHRHGLAPEALVLELCGNDPRVPMSELEQRLLALRDLGVGIALDGFGGGYAAVSALRRLPLDIICLDRGLVDGIAESARLRKITAGLLRIAGDLGLSSVADGVDLPEQVSTLRAMGCTWGQGEAFAGVLDEHRLRRALACGYPLPGRSAGHAAGRADRVRTRGSVVVAGGLPVQRTGPPSADKVARPSRGPHSETPVPPT
ncbi:putative bifunctional diguanylate cyclase/phosphodiesterase [Streptomyces oceani]|nr:diguanylate cyclase [Streptomyces oceani]